MSSWGLLGALGAACGTGHFCSTVKVEAAWRTVTWGALKPDRLRSALCSVSFLLAGCVSSGSP